MGVSFTIAAGPRQHKHSRVRVPRDSWTYFIISDSRLPQPGGPGHHIYIPQEQSGPLMPSGTEFHFRRLLLLAGLRWRYSNPRPHSKSEAKSKLLYDWRFTTYQFVLASSPLRPMIMDFFQLNSCDNCPYVTASLTRRWIYLLWICLAFRQVYISHI
jgi:hypothetical protein